MRPLLLFCCTLTLMAGHFAAVQADDDTAARRAIMAAYASGDVAVARKDVKALLARLTLDYKATDFEGNTQTRDAYAKRAMTWFGMFQAVKAQTTVRQLTIHGARATATGSQKATATIDVPGLHQQVVKNSDFQDTWIRSGNRWLKQRSHVTRRAAPITIDLPGSAPPRKP